MFCSSSHFYNRLSVIEGCSGWSGRPHSNTSASGKVLGQVEMEPSDQGPSPGKDRETVFLLGGPPPAPTRTSLLALGRGSVPSPERGSSALGHFLKRRLRALRGEGAWNPSIQQEPLWWVAGVDGVLGGQDLGPPGMG